MGQADEGEPVVIVRGVKYTVCQDARIKDIPKD
jgi:F420-0:gamma-glutamyl ligase